MELKISEFLRPAADMAASVKEMVKGTPLEMLTMPLQQVYAPVRDILRAQDLAMPESAPLPGELEYYIAKNVEEGKILMIPAMPRGGEESLGEPSKQEMPKGDEKGSIKIKIKEA